MRSLRRVHVVAVLLAGTAIGFDHFGARRAAVVTIALVLILLVRSLEQIRVFLERK